MGEVGAAWVLCESPEGLIIIDQHAAHERVRFHEFMQKELFPSMALLLPLKVKIPLAAQGNEEKFFKLLKALGLREFLIRKMSLSF